MLIARHEIKKKNYMPFIILYTPAIEKKTKHIIIILFIRQFTCTHRRVHGGGNVGNYLPSDEGFYPLNILY